MSDVSEPPLSLTELLSRLSREASDLARMTMRAEAALHGMLDGIETLPAEVGMDLQHIDLVRQSLEDIARLLGAASEMVPVEHRFGRAAVRRSVRLTGLAARLTGAHYVAAGVQVPGARPDDELPGDLGLELF